MRKKYALLKSRVHPPPIDTSVHVVISTASSPPLIVDVNVCNCPISMEVDSGAGASIMSLAMFKRLYPTLNLSVSSISLCSASGPLSVIGECVVTVSMFEKLFNLTLVVCTGDQLEVPLLGRPWLDILVPQWRSVLSPTVYIASILQAKPPSVEELEAMFPRAFGNSDTPIEKYSARLVLKPNAVPVKHRAYKPPFGLVNTANSLLDSWEESGKAIRVRCADWASPGFLVPKSDNSYRMVVDFKKTLNPQLRVDHYPIPSPEEIFSSLSNSSVFVSLDLKDAYTQLSLHPDSQDLCVVNTHRGFYKLTRLIYGVASAAAIFQSVMEEMLAGIPGVIIYLDNVLIQAESMNVLIQRTLLVLGRMDRFNVHLKKPKCEWFVSKLEFLGFIISQHGRQPTPTLVAAIDNFPVPTISASY